MLEFKSSWVKHLPLVEFTYNNSYQASISMVPYEALYERKCKTPICWDEVKKRMLNDVKLIEVTTKKIQIIRERLKTTQDRQKSYADTRKRELEFKVGGRYGVLKSSSLEKSDLISEKGQAESKVY